MLSGNPRQRSARLPFLGILGPWPQSGTTARGKALRKSTRARRIYNGDFDTTTGTHEPLAWYRLQRILNGRKEHQRKAVYAGDLLYPIWSPAAIVGARFWLKQGTKLRVLPPLRARGGFLESYTEEECGGVGPGQRECVGAA